MKQNKHILYGVSSVRRQKIHLSAEDTILIDAARQPEARQIPPETLKEIRKNARQCFLWLLPLELLLAGGGIFCAFFCSDIKWTLSFIFTGMILLPFVILLFCSARLRESAVTYDIPIHQIEIQTQNRNSRFAVFYLPDGKYRLPAPEDTTPDTIRVIHDGCVHMARFIKKESEHEKE